MGEFERIRAFLRPFGPLASAFARVGPGDDCAVLPSVRGELCVTTDAVVEGVHFRRPAFSLQDVGWKALAVNLSDLAAMGATPRWMVVAVAAPKDFSNDDARAVARGMAALARRHRVALVGGNFSRARELSLTLTLAGETPRGRALLRSGAREGDVLLVVGALGLAALGLSLLPSGHGRTPPVATGLWGRALAAQRRPTPLVEVGRAVRPHAHAAIDVSDGFAQDLSHLCDASGVGANVSLDALTPLSPEWRRHPGEAAERRALGGGEDYALLFAVPERKVPAALRAARRAGGRAQAVGHFVRRRGVLFTDRDGRPSRPPSGHDHFI